MSKEKLRDKLATKNEIITIDKAKLQAQLDAAVNQITLIQSTLNKSEKRLETLQDKIFNADI